MTSDIELADLNSSILRNASFPDVDSILNFYTYLFAKENPEFLINVKFFIQAEYSEALRFSMILLLLVKTVISSFLREIFLICSRTSLSCAYLLLFF